MQVVSVLALLNGLGLAVMLKLKAQDIERFAGTCCCLLLNFLGHRLAADSGHFHNCLTVNHFFKI